MLAQKQRGVGAGGRGPGDGFVFESRLLAHPPFLWEGVTAKVDVDIMFSLGQIVPR